TPPIMRTRLLTSFLLALAACSAREPVLLSVVTYNVHHGEDQNGAPNYDRVGELLREWAPDLVALQEVDVRTTRVGGLDMVDEYAVRSGLEGVFGQAMPFDGGGYGEAVLAGIAIDDWTNHPLPHAPNHEPRAALEMRVRARDGTLVAFVGTHLDHTGDPADRIAQAARLVELFAGREEPVVLVGDFNSLPDSEAMRLLFAAGFVDAAAEHPQFTFPAERPERRIDWILVAPAHRWRVRQVGTVAEGVASDHRPLRATLELLPAR
ncbi:MAG TPA: endonuclease/exonuclease/phosphatase family protein, partial [Planctomycetota bacterium]